MSDVSCTTTHTHIHTHTRARICNSRGGGRGRGSKGSRETIEHSKTNIYISGLKPSTTDDDLREMCREYGVIVSAKAIIDREQNVCKGYVRSLKIARSTHTHTHTHTRARARAHTHTHTHWHPLTHTGTLLHMVR